MSGNKTDEQTGQPMVRFGDDWIPAHEAWKKLHTAGLVADAIERFNNEFPDLATADTREVVTLARQRLQEIELRIPGKDV